MNFWSESGFEVRDGDAGRRVTGLASGPFGIFDDGNRQSPRWRVIHTPTGLSIGEDHVFESDDIAKEFVARILPLVDWADIDTEPPAQIARAIVDIAQETLLADPIEAVARIPPYIGDDAFRAFLRQCRCRYGLELVRMRFIGCAFQPFEEADIYPILEDIFDYDLPEFSGWENLRFLQTFLALFQEVAEHYEESPVTLSEFGDVSSLHEVIGLLQRRSEEVLDGFLAGIWLGGDELPLSDSLADMLAALDEVALSYEILSSKASNAAGSGAPDTVSHLLGQIQDLDRRAETTIASVLETFRNHPPDEHPCVRRTRSLLEEMTSTGTLPRGGIRHCLEQRGRMAPILLQLLQNPTDWDLGFGEPEDLLFLVIHILGEMREPRAFAPLVDLISGEARLVERILGDAITENLAKILISVFDGDAGRLYKLMDDPDADEFVRGAVFDAWTYYVAAGRIERVEAEDYLSSGLETLRPREDHMIWFAWAEAIANLGFVNLTEEVRKAFDIGLVPQGTFPFEEFKKDVEDAARAEDPLDFVTAQRLVPFTSTIEALANWQCFSEESIRQQDAALRQHAPPPLTVGTVTNPYRNVGRNDPCPCGSGKKYKKCCLR